MQAAQAKEARQQWKKPPKKKTVVQHRTFEEIMEDAGPDAPAASGIGMIIDATGATVSPVLLSSVFRPDTFSLQPREVSSLTEVSVSPWGATNDPTRLPELRHNLRIIVDQAKVELDGLAREAKALQERKQWIRNEDARLRKVVLEEAERMLPLPDTLEELAHMTWDLVIQRLQNVHIIVDDISGKEVGPGFQ